MPKNYWLMKSEPHTFSFQDLQNRPNQTEPWDGVRNYQARNFMRDQMKLGDIVLFYHSSCKTPSIIGLATVTKESHPDHTSWDPKSPYFDPKSSPENPRWFMVSISYLSSFKNPVSLNTIKATPSLNNMKLVQPGQRLSIQPVSKEEFLIIQKLAS